MKSPSCAYFDKGFICCNSQALFRQSISSDYRHYLISYLGQEILYIIYILHYLVWEKADSYPFLWIFWYCFTVLINVIVFMVISNSDFHQIDTLFCMRDLSTCVRYLFCGKNIVPNGMVSPQSSFKFKNTKWGSG